MTIQKPGMQEPFERALRWMEENVIIASGIYRSFDLRLHVTSGIKLDGEGNPVSRSWERPEDCQEWMLNSALALTCCCYIAALGKIAAQGDKTLCERARFTMFLERYVKTFVSDPSSTGPAFQSLELEGKHEPHGGCKYDGGNVGTEALYTEFRNSFVHGFWPKDGGLIRGEVLGHYWADPRQAAAWLNADQLACGLLEGIRILRDEYAKRADADPCIYANAMDWLMDDPIRAAKKAKKRGKH